MKLCHKYGGRLLCLCVAATCLWIGVSSHAHPPVMVEDLEVTCGQREVLLPDGYQGLTNFSDMPICIISKSPMRYTLVGMTGTVLMRGASLRDASPIRSLLLPGKPGTFDDAYAGISSLYRLKKGLLATYHAEQHLGEVHQLGQYCNPTMNYWSVGLAISTDGGNSFRKLGQLIRSSVGVGAFPAQQIQGLGDPHLCAEPNGEYLYLYYTDITGGNGKWAQICMARCAVDEADKPGAWRKYCNGDFKEPGLGGKETPILPEPFPGAGVENSQVRYIQSMRRFIMICTAVSEDEQNPGDPPRKSGMFCAVSTDGISWSRPTKLFSCHVHPQIGRETNQHPSLLVEQESPERVRGTVVHGYSHAVGNQPGQAANYLVSFPITFVLKTHDADTHKAEKSTAGERTSLAGRLKGTTWVNTNKATFEWTPDGRLLHNNTERQWRVLDDGRVEITFDPSKKATLTFDKDLTHFDQPLGDGKKFEGVRRQKPTQPPSETIVGTWRWNVNGELYKCDKDGKLTIYDSTNKQIGGGRWTVGPDGVIQISRPNKMSHEVRFEAEALCVITMVMPDGKTLPDRILIRQ